MPEPGFTVSREFAADAAATVDAGEHAPADLWHAIATAGGFQRTLTDAVRALLADVPHYARRRKLLDAGVTAAEDGYATVATALNGPYEDISAEAYASERSEISPVQYHSVARHREAREITAAFGQGTVTPIGRLALEAIEDGPLAILDAADVVPTVAVRIGQSFRERRREHRERTCQLLARLGQVCHVTVVATGLTARWLAREHGDEFPRSFTECRC